MALVSTMTGAVLGEGFRRSLVMESPASSLKPVDFLVPGQDLVLLLRSQAVLALWEVVAAVVGEGVLVAKGGQQRTQMAAVPPQTRVCADFVSYVQRTGTASSLLDVTFTTTLIPSECPL